MNERVANEIASALGGEVWQSGGDIHVVTLKRPDDSLVVFSEDLVAEYIDDEAFENNAPTSRIFLRESPDEYWVIEDENGDLWMQYPRYGRGCATEEDAERQAADRISRIGLRYFVRPKWPGDSPRP